MQRRRTSLLFRLLEDCGLGDNFGDSCSFYTNILALSFPIVREKYPQGDELRWRPCASVVSCAHITANQDLPRYIAILSPSVQRRTRPRIAGRRLYGAKQARKLLPPKHVYVIDENCHTWDFLLEVPGSTV